MNRFPASTSSAIGTARRATSFFTPDRIHYMIAVLLLAAGLAHLIRIYMRWETPEGIFLGIGIGIALIASGIGRRPSVSQGIALLWSAVPLLLIALWYYFVVSFGQFDLAAITFHYQIGINSPLVVLEYLRDAIPVILGVLAVLAGLAMMVKRDGRIRRIERLAVLPLLLFNPAMPEIISTAQSGVRVDDRLDRRYVDPATIPTPTVAPRNYIHLFLESAERTYFHESFGDVMAPLAPFEASGISATDIRQTQLTSWSAAGITAANCGVPLFRAGLFNRSYFKHAQRFMPEATCTGDLLARAGYNLSYIMGAEMSFGGIGYLFATHGGYRLVGVTEMRERYGGVETTWGPDDETVFEAAFDEVARLAAAGRPFALTVDTAGGHAPRGYVAAGCRTRPDIAGLSPSILAGVKCTNWLAARFLTRLREAKLLSNTIVVVQSDHLAMQSPVTGKLDALERRNLFFAFGDGIDPGVVDKTSSPVDIMPTVLSLLGYELEGGRAGLGVSLLSAQPSLVGELGEDEYNDAVLKDSVLGRRFWTTERAEGS